MEMLCVFKHTFWPEVTGEGTHLRRISIDIGASSVAQPKIHKVIIYASKSKEAQSLLLLFYSYTTEPVM